MKKVILIVSLLLTTFVSIPTYANAKSAEWCEKQWQLESSDTSNNGLPNYENLLEKWKSYHEACNGTIIYEANLALLYASVKKLVKAREIINSVHSVPASQYSYLLELVSIHIDAIELETQGHLLNTKKLLKIEQKYLAFTKKYPHIPEGFGQLGNYQTLLGKYNEAIKSLEISSNRLIDKWGIHRNLTINYTAIGRYKDAIESANIAYELNNNLTSDPDFVFALVKTNAALGDYESAQAALKVIAAKVPGVKNSDEFADAANFLIKEIDKKTVRKNAEAKSH